jgi:hypothetical protein
MIKNDAEKFKNLFHSHYRIEQSLRFGAIAALCFVLANLVGNNYWLGVLLITSIIHYFRGLYSFPVGKYEKYTQSRFENSLNDLLVASASCGLELIDCFNDMYVFKTRYSLFQNSRVIVKDCKKYCEVISQDTVSKCLGEHLVSRKV